MAYNSLRKQLGLERPKPQTPAAAPARPQANGNEAKAGRGKPIEADVRLIVTRSCGCKVGIRYLQQSACEGCQRKKRIAKGQARAKEQRKQASRLPDGSTLCVVYDASTQSWFGTLTIGDKTFEGKASALFKLEMELDAMYRRSLEPAGRGEK
jgi:hypothetical protein